MSGAISALYVLREDAPGIAPLGLRRARGSDRNMIEPQRHEA